jgi:hypothetical protein
MFRLCILKGQLLIARRYLLELYSMVSELLLALDTS